MSALSADIDKRLIELEIKASLADDLLDQLNHTVFKQQQRIELLARELAELRQQLRDSRPASGASPQDEIPPHY